jgi:hypothetical protein
MFVSIVSQPEYRFNTPLRNLCLEHMKLRGISRERGSGGTPAQVSAQMRAFMDVNFVFQLVGAIFG